MEFVKSFNLLKKDAKQIPCITGSGAPTTETEGAVGCLYMDEDTGKMYKCVSAIEGVYGWKSTADEVVVDSEYTPESKNAQSGKAVRKAIADNNNSIANALTETKTGRVVAAKDVSPLNHSLKIRLHAVPEPRDLSRAVISVSGNDEAIAVSFNAGKLTLDGTVITSKLRVAINDFELPAGAYKMRIDDPKEKGSVVFSVNGNEVYPRVNQDYYFEMNTSAAFGTTTGYYLQYRSKTNATGTAIETEFDHYVVNIGITPVIATTDFSSKKITMQGGNLFNKNGLEPSNNNEIVPQKVDGNDCVLYSNAYYSNTKEGLQTAIYNHCVCVPCLPKTTYTVSRATAGCLRLAVFETQPYDEPSKPIAYVGEAAPSTVCTVTTPSNAAYLIIWFSTVNAAYGESNPTDTNYVKSILASLQVEIGPDVTRYMPYVEPEEFTANAAGVIEGVSSVFVPHFTLISDEKDIQIECTYNKDISMSVLPYPTNYLVQHLFKECASKPIITFVDDDSADIDNAQTFHDCCEAAGIKGGFAVLTTQLDKHTDNSLTDLLLQYEREGYHMTIHSNSQDWRYQPTARTKGGVITNWEPITDAEGVITGYNKVEIKMTETAPESTSDETVYTSVNLSGVQPEQVYTGANTGLFTTVAAFDKVTLNLNGAVSGANLRIAFPIFLSAGTYRIYIKAPKDSEGNNKGSAVMYIGDRQLIGFTVNKEVTFTLDTETTFAKESPNCIQYRANKDTVFNEGDTVTLSIEAVSVVAADLRNRATVTTTPYDVDKENITGDAIIEYNPEYNLADNYAKCESELVLGLQKMQKYGFTDYKFWCTPFGAKDVDMQNLARKWGMNCLVSSGDSAYNDSKNTYSRWGIRRVSLQNPTKESDDTKSVKTLRAVIDKAATDNGWVLVTTHMSEEGWQNDAGKQRFVDIVNYAKLAGFEVKTLNEAFRIREPLYRFYETF